MKRIVIITALVFGLSGLCATAGDAAAPGRKGKSGAGKRGADAQGASEHKSSHPYIRCDKNGDGVLSREEWPFSAELFTKLDKNGNGIIAADERPEKRGKLGKGGEGKGKGGPGRRWSSQRQGWAWERRTRQTLSCAEMNQPRR
jgi:hypothetical protein